MAVEGSEVLRTPAPAVPWVWPTLHEGQRSIVLDLLVHGPRSRADLVRRSGLSRASLSRLTRDLVGLELIEENGTAVTTGPGRPSDIVAIRPDAAHFVGMKLTGEALYVAVTDLRATIVAEEEHPLVSRRVEDVVATMADAVARARVGRPRMSGVGVCLAGDVRIDDGLGVVVSSDFLGWGTVGLEALVTGSTGLPTMVSNDVQALTLAHHWFGAGVGTKALAVIGMGAGIGAGLVVHNELIWGAKGHPGKVSHVPVTSTGARCDRGHDGCASAYVTIPAVLRNSGRATFDEALAAAKAGDERADAAMRSACQALGAIVAHIVNLMDPERVVITGEGRAVGDYDAELFERSIAERLDPASAMPSVVNVPFRFTDYAWGAAIAAMRQLV